MDLTTVADGRQAVEAAAAAEFDLILMDIHMPEMDGLEAGRRIRAQLGERTPPMFALSADVFHERTTPDSTRVFDGYLLKPVSLQTLQWVLSDAREQPAPVTESNPGPIRQPVKERARPTEEAVETPNDLKPELHQEVLRLHGELQRRSGKSSDEDFVDLAHQLRGVAAWFDLKELMDSAAALEHSAREKNVSAVPRQLQRLGVIIDAMLDSKTS